MNKEKGFSADSSQPLKMAVSPRPVSMNIYVLTKQRLGNGIEDFSISHRYFASKKDADAMLDECRRELVERRHMDIIHEEKDGFYVTDGGYFRYNCYVSEEELIEPSKEIEG